MHRNSLLTMPNAQLAAVWRNGGGSDNPSGVQMNVFKKRKNFNKKLII